MHQTIVNWSKREVQNKHKSINLWFTGQSGSGNSTLAHAVEERLHELGCKTFAFDGDKVRHCLCSDVDFSEKSRS